MTKQEKLLKVMLALKSLIRGIPDSNEYSISIEHYKIQMKKNEKNITQWVATIWVFSEAQNKWREIDCFTGKTVKTVMSQLKSKIERHELAHVLQPEPQYHQHQCQKCQCFWIKEGDLFFRVGSLAAKCCSGGIINSLFSENVLLIEPERKALHE